LKHLHVVQDTPMDVSLISPIQAPLDPAKASAQTGSFFRVGDLVTPIASTLRMGLKRPRLPLENNWIELLSRYDWQWFATLTFKEATHPEAADKRYRYWIRQLDESNGFRYGRKSTLRYCCLWARGLEWQKRDVLHFHALISNIPYELTSSAQMRAWSDAWFLMGNTGFAKILPVSDIGGVAGYISKYCAKGGEVDLSANLPSGPDLSGVATASQTR
jgi:hypothetical protein